MENSFSKKKLTGKDGKGVLILLIVFVAIIIVAPCLLQCLQKMINRSMHTIWLVETKKGGTL